MILASSFCVTAQEKAEEKPQTTAYLVADAHLDTQWNWDIQTTISEYVRNTLFQNLFLLQKYPDYVFNFEGGIKYAWMKEYFPREYELLKPYIKADRWHISGASWDATDAVVPSTESAIRNILLGQEFYRDEFGVESTDIFLPDCFGFPYTLPTVASHCGLIGFSSQKLGWRKQPFYEGGAVYPYTIGLWKGVDGSEIMMTHGFGYGHRFEPEDQTGNKMLERRAAQSPLNTVYHYYGTGDIGGSPTPNSVYAVQKSVGSDGPVKIISATSDQLYRDLQPYSSHPELPSFDGELLMDLHGTGCYTSQAAMKLYNRQNEQLGDAAERAAVAAELLGLQPYPSENITEGWRRFIFHQFHDDLTGTSIPRAYEFSWNDEILTLKQFSDIVSSAAGAVASQLDTRVKGTPLVVYNPLGFPSAEVVEVSMTVPGNTGAVEVFEAAGKRVPTQMLPPDGGKIRFLAELSAPANGFGVFDVRSASGGKIFTPVAADKLENSVYSISFDKNGDITSLTDKRSDRQLVKEGKAIRLAMFTENESFDWPAWEVLKKTVDGTPESIVENVSMQLIENGPVRTTLRIDKKHGDSHFTQYVSLYEGDDADRIDFYNEIDWASLNSLLKAEFPLNLDNENATYDLGIGTIERGNNRPNAYEVPAQQWADLSDASGDYGVTIMNDSKYGWDKPDNNTLRLTLLHTPKTLNSYTYQDHQDHGYHTFTYSLRGHEGKLDKAETSQKAAALNQKPRAFATVKHPGKLGKNYSLASIDNPQLAIKALKKAEKGDEYIVRVYETGGNGTESGNVSFATDILEAWEADGTEKNIGKADFSGNNLKVEVGPNSLRTYRVRLAKAEPAYGDFEIVELPFDKKSFSWNEFRNDAAFESDYSYAAELIPDRLLASGVPFRLENKELFNSLSAKGDTIEIDPAKRYTHLYLLAAAATPEQSVDCTVRTNKESIEINVPSYTGFVGQWGHSGHTQGYMRPQEVAYTGTHRHSGAGDCPYEFTYMYKYDIPLAPGTTRVILPENPYVVFFAATLGTANPAVTSATEPFRLAIKNPKAVEPSSDNTEKPNILKPEYIIGYSGYVNEAERPEFLVDGNDETKWCDVTTGPSYVDFDLGETRPVNGWKMINAGNENPSYITACALLMGRNDKSEEWRTLDHFAGNRANTVKRTLAREENVRYLRLFVVQPLQGEGGKEARIYELAVY